MSRLVILSGPSCAGKSPLLAALKRLHPDLAEGLRPVVLYNSRDPRPGERDGEDYRFRPRGEIEDLRERDGFVVMDVRGDLQALDTAELADMLAEGDVFFEGNPFVGARLLEVDLPEGAERLGAFLSPLTREEIAFIASDACTRDAESFVTDVMRRKLLRRTRNQKGMLSRPDLDEVERRAGSAYGELKRAWRFGRVICCHDGEDSENWDAFYYPLGDARRALAAFAALLRGERPEGVESWDEHTVP